MAVTVQCRLRLFIFYRPRKSAWWSQVIALAGPRCIGGRKAEATLKTVDASVIEKHPHSALQRSLIFRSCHSQEGSRTRLSPEPPTQGWWMRCWTYGSRKEWLVLGHLRAPPADPMAGLTACWCHLGHLRAPPAPFPGHTWATASSHWLQSWCCGCFHLYSLCQWTFCWGDCALARAILMNLNLLLLSVFLFFQRVEPVWGRSILHLEDGQKWLRPSQRWQKAKVRLVQPKPPFQTCLLQRISPVTGNRDSNKKPPHTKKWNVLLDCSNMVRTQSLGYLVYTDCKSGFWHIHGGLLKCCDATKQSHIDVLAAFPTQGEQKSLWQFQYRRAQRCVSI